MSEVHSHLHANSEINGGGLRGSAAGVRQRKPGRSRENSIGTILETCFIIFGGGCYMVLRGDMERFSLKVGFGVVSECTSYCFQTKAFERGETVANSEVWLTSVRCMCFCDMICWCDGSILDVRNIPEKLHCPMCSAYFRTICFSG